MTVENDNPLVPDPSAMPPRRAGISEAAMIGGVVGIVFVCMAAAAIIILIGVATRRSDEPSEPGEAEPTSIRETAPAGRTPSATGSPGVYIGPTPTAPRLSIPALSCIFSSSEGNCYDYCQNPANKAECDSARAQIEGQGADPDAFFECMRTDEIDPLTCMKEGWYANQSSD